MLVLLALTAQWIFALGFFVLATGFVSSVLSPTIQTRLMDVAEDNQSIAAALNHSALNIGNALGAFLGGVVIALGLGLRGPRVGRRAPRGRRPRHRRREPARREGTSVERSRVAVGR